MSYHCIYNPIVLSYSIQPTVETSPDNTLHSPHKHNQLQQNNTYLFTMASRSVISKDETDVPDFPAPAADEKSDISPAVPA